jgi:putative transposase
MILAHRIALDPTPEQANYFARAAGTRRMVYNWALDEWNRQYASGTRPNAMQLKKQFNAIKYAEFPWLKDIHRDAHAAPFDNLSSAWKQFFADVKVKLPAHAPVFKKKGHCRDGFYVANDKFEISGKSIRLPKIGWITLKEALRFEGKIMGANVSRTADHWFVSVQVDVPDQTLKRARTANDTVGVDLGIITAACLSTGEKITSPRPLKQALRRLKIRQRRIGRKVEAAKIAAGLALGARLPKGTRLPQSANRLKSAQSVARLYERIGNIRADFTHKLTTRLCRENQTVVIEDLNVKGMLKHEKLARAISDVGMGEFRRQMIYKAQRFDTILILADRWFPSTKLCSFCGEKNGSLTLKDREWTCPSCGTHHDRDINAAINLKRLATETALPVASVAGNSGTGVGATLPGRESNVCQ